MGFKKGEGVVNRREYGIGSKIKPVHLFFMYLKIQPIRKRLAEKLIRRDVRDVLIRSD